VADSPVERPPMALAMEWISKVTTVALEMVLPGLAGHWLDQRVGVRFFAPAGFVLGLVCGMWHLLVMTGAIGGQHTKGGPPDNGDSYP